MYLFISGSDCGMRRWSTSPEANGDAVPGTAPDRRCAHAQLLTFTHRQLFCNHLTYSHFTLTFAHMHDVEHFLYGQWESSQEDPYPCGV